MCFAIAAVLVGDRDRLMQFVQLARPAIVLRATRTAYRLGSRAPRMSVGTLVVPLVIDLVDAWRRHGLLTRARGAATGVARPPLRCCSPGEQAAVKIIRRHDTFSLKVRAQNARSACASP